MLAVHSAAGYRERGLGVTTNPTAVPLSRKRDTPCYHGYR